MQLCVNFTLAGVALNDRLILSGNRIAETQLHPQQAEPISSHSKSRANADGWEVEEDDKSGGRGLSKKIRVETVPW